MYHSGIGGGGFMLVRGPDGQYESIDFRETAPAAAYENMYENLTMGSIFGGLASGIPGEIRGLEYLHKKYGVEYSPFSSSLPLTRDIGSSMASRL
jgi:gamma-glutamyltranspeptidase/glutathione hydrolase